MPPAPAQTTSGTPKGSTGKTNRLHDDYEPLLTMADEMPLEYARELECFIRHNKPLWNKLNKKGVNRDVLAGFCIHYAKLMKSQILDRVSGRIQSVVIGYEEFDAFFPQIGDILVDELLTTAAKAWDSQTEACGLCPSRCISEKEEYAPMFDDPDHWK